MLAGAAIGAKVQNFWIISAATLALHFILDALPHWEYNSGLENDFIPKRNFFYFAAKVALDLAIGSFLVFFFWRHSPYLTFAIFGAIFGILPDGFVLLHIALKSLLNQEPKIIKKVRDFHHAIHRPKNKNPRLAGVLIESLAVLLALYFTIF